MEAITQSIVDENLNAALDNHYDDIRTWEIDEVGFDLMAFADGFENSTVDELRPLIQNWRERQKGYCSICHEIHEGKHK